MSRKICHHCSSSISSDESQCPHCGVSQGYEPRGSQGYSNGSREESPRHRNENSIFSLKLQKYVASGIVGFGAAFFGRLIALNFGYGYLGFVGTWVGVWLYTYQKGNPARSMASGLYIISVLMAVTPLFINLPFSPGQRASLEIALNDVSRAEEVVVEGFIYVIFATVLGLTGYFLERYSNRNTGRF